MAFFETEQNSGGGGGGNDRKYGTVSVSTSYTEVDCGFSADELWIYVQASSLTIHCCKIILGASSSKMYGVYCTGGYFNTFNNLNTSDFVKTANGFKIKSSTYSGANVQYCAIKYDE